MDQFFIIPKPDRSEHSIKSMQEVKLHFDMGANFRSGCLIISLVEKFSSNLYTWSCHLLCNLAAQRNDGLLYVSKLPFEVSGYYFNPLSKLNKWWTYYKNSMLNGQHWLLAVAQFKNDMSVGWSITDNEKKKYVESHCCIPFKDFVPNGLLAAIKDSRSHQSSRSSTQVCTFLCESCKNDCDLWHGGTSSHRVCKDWGEKLDWTVERPRCCYRTPDQSYFSLTFRISGFQGLSVNSIVVWVWVFPRDFYLI